MLKRNLFWFVIVPLWLISTIGIFVIANVKHAPIGMTLLSAFEVALVCAGLFYLLAYIYRLQDKQESLDWEINLEDVQYFKHKIKLGRFWFCVGQPSEATITGEVGFYVPVYFCLDAPEDYTRGSKLLLMYDFNVAYGLAFRDAYEVIAQALTDTFPDANPLEYRVDARMLRGLEEQQRYVHLIYAPYLTVFSPTLAYEYQLRLSDAER